MTYKLQINNFKCIKARIEILRYMYIVITLTMEMI